MKVEETTTFIRYFIHFPNMDKRLDRWVAKEDIIQVYRTETEATEQVSWIHTLQPFFFMSDCSGEWITGYAHSWHNNESSMAGALQILMLRHMVSA